MLGTVKGKILARGKKYQKKDTMKSDQINCNFFGTSFGKPLYFRGGGKWVDRGKGVWLSYDLFHFSHWSIFCDDTQAYAATPKKPPINIPIICIYSSIW